MRLWREGASGGRRLGRGDKDSESESVRVDSKRAESGRGFAAALLPRLFGKNPRSHRKAPPIEFQLETHGFQFYAIANLDKPETQASHSGSCVLVWGR